jgi:hypothetical protein
MLTYNDVKEMSDLSDEEIAFIAEHEHLPEICAAELGYYLVHSENGVPMLHRAILDDLEHAKAHHDEKKVARLRLVLKRFIETHPEHGSETAEDRAAREQA